MTIADTSRGEVSYVKEVTIGTTPAAALTELRFTGESLSQNKTTKTSDEIRSDRQITDLVAVDSEPSGEINVEHSYDNLDDFMPAALLSSGWSTTVAVSETDISVSDADNSYNTSVGDFTAENISVGQWVKVAGCSDAANNGFKKVVSIVTGKLIVSQTLVTESATTVTMSGSMIRNGVTAHGFSLQKEFTDIGQFLFYRGMEVNTLSVDVTSNELVTGSIGFIGRTAGIAQATIGTGANIAAPTKDIFNATSNVAQVRENDIALSASTFYAMGVSVNVDNGLRGQKAISVDGNVGIGKSRCTVTGTVNAYFSSEVLYEKFLDNTDTSLDFILTDGEGNTYIITLPKVNYTSSNPELSGIDTDVLIAMEYQALRDETTDSTIQIDRFPI